MPRIMNYFIVFKAVKALSYWVFVLFYLFFLHVQKNPKTPKNPLGWALKKTVFFEPCCYGDHSLLCGIGGIVTSEDYSD